MNLTNNNFYQEIKELLYSAKNEVYQIYASKYLTILPNKEEFKKLLEEN
ncbi:hypothetical protein [Aliarcobacter butzleri]